MGNAAAWKQEWSLPLALHRADQELLTWLGAHPGLVVTEMLEAAGAPPELAGPARDAFVELRTLFQPLEFDLLLEGGEVIPTALGPMEAIWTPGHCAGHLCFYLRDSKTLIAGDHLLDGITPNIPWRGGPAGTAAQGPAGTAAYGNDALRDYLASLERVQPYDIDWVLPSHGEPFQDHQTWISETRRHHEERCAALIAGLDEGPLTAHQLLPRLWRRTFSPFHYRFALDEILAHLQYALGEQYLEVADPGPPVLWRKRRF
jgi:glyoxylase-like metal-dependent hydrolase (beta-lactamase superfamily II)